MAHEASPQLSHAMKYIVATAALGLSVVAAQAQVPAQSLKNVSIKNSSGQLAFILLSSTVRSFVVHDGNVVASMQLVGHADRRPTRFVAYVSGCEAAAGAMTLWNGSDRGEPIPWSNQGIQVGDAIAVTICRALASTQRNERYSKCGQYRETYRSVDNSSDVQVFDGRCKHSASRMISAHRIATS